MSKLVPKSVRESIVGTLTREAAASDWDHSLQSDKTRLLRQWVERDDVGGILRPLLGSDAEVRMWLKDVALKRRARAALPKAAEIVAHLFGDGSDVEIKREGIKPAHCYLTYGHRNLFVCWERSVNAKHLLWASVRVLIEEPATQEAHMVFVESISARTPQTTRLKLNAIAARCGVNVRWLET